MLLRFHEPSSNTAVRCLATIDDMSNECFKRFLYKCSVGTDCLIQVHRKWQNWLETKELLCVGKHRDGIRCYVFTKSKSIYKYLRRPKCEHRS